MSAELESEKAKREAAEKAAREAAANAAAERNARETAEREAREATAKVAAERDARLAAEQTAREAVAQAADERAARVSAEKSAREAAANAAQERSAREESEAAARVAAAQVIVEHAARESAEKVAREAVAKTSAVKPSSASPVPSAPTSGQTPGEQVRRRNAPSWLVPMVVFAIAGGLFWLISGQWTNWESSWSVKTDDAYIRADVAPLSTKMVGTVLTTRVKDFDKVKAGQVLVELKNDDYRAQVDQAQAAVRQVESKLSDMKQRKEQQDARVLDAQSVLDNGRAVVRQTDDSIVAAQATIDEAEAGIDAARAAITQSRAAAKAASADVTRTSLERARQEGLLADESTTKEKVEQVVNENERAIANLEAQKAAEEKAHAELAARRAQLNKARQQLLTSRTEREKSLSSVRGREAEVTAQRKQRELLDGEEKQLTADLAAKKAALAAAQVNLDYTIVRAPRDGIVGELKVKPGQLVSSGTQVIAMISSTPWVIANYRETQLAKVKNGDRVDIDIDALPGTHLKGHVEAVAPASGAQFSLLPPDNASGNFTKITQRIPVKICFDEDQQKLAPLRPGMSAVTTIRPGSSR